MQYWGAAKNDRVVSVLQVKPFNITVIQVYAPRTNAEEAEADWFYGRPTRHSRANTKKISFSLEGAGMQK